MNTDTPTPRTDEEINIAIAEICGWEEIGKYDPYRGISPQWKDAKAFDGSPLVPPIWEIPDFCNDLNAMREAEMLLYKENCLAKKYTQNLKKVICLHAGTKRASMDFDICITAPARQRAEAFLKTLKKYSENSITFKEAWEIQHAVGSSLDHDPKCSSVAGHHPLSGSHLLCDCGAIEREFIRQKMKKQP